VETDLPTSSTESKPLVAVVFSKDRPLQLDAALASLFLRCTDPERMEINVLYTTSSAYQEGLYRQLSLEYPGVVFQRERHFRKDVLALVARARYVAFVVDDALFVREFSVGTVIEQLGEIDAAIGFSLRLGTNTTYCYPMDSQQALPESTTVRPGVLAYRWPGASHDFGYPFDLSSSVYRSADIEPLLRRIPFTNPNLMEGRLAEGAAASGTRRPVLLCFERSSPSAYPPIWSRRSRRTVQELGPTNPLSPSPPRSSAAIASTFRATTTTPTRRAIRTFRFGCARRTRFRPQFR
jgi:hypothetical protein